MPAVVLSYICCRSACTACSRLAQLVVVTAVWQGAMLGAGGKMMVPVWTISSCPLPHECSVRSWDGQKKCKSYVSEDTVDVVASV